MSYLRSMKALTSFIMFFITFSLWAAWENPAVLCPEEILPQGLPCLDLSSVKNPYLDFPASMPADEKHEWIKERASDLKLCRSQEVLAREEKRPGSFTPLQVELSWMIVNGGEDTQEKLESILNASRKHEIPPQILIGALTQESLLANLGISPDGGNYSCGIAQLNVQEWCLSAQSLPQAEREKMGWPTLNCNSPSLETNMVKPFYDIAIKRLGTRHDYQMRASDFDGITLNDVAHGFPAASSTLQLARFQAVSSFLKHCQNYSLSIPFKAQTLKNLFKGFVPQSLKTSQIYSESQSFERKCSSAYPSKYYPLHTGWLLAVAAYNAGPRQTQLVEHYFQVKNNVFPNLTPLDLIEALHWGGQAKENSKRVFFSGQNQVAQSQLWYKSCVVQRHVARVIQHVAQPGVVLAKSLEQVPCAQGEIPRYRRLSTGVKAPVTSR